MKLTVVQLRELLKDVPDEYLIRMEGCDCTGLCSEGEVDAETKELYLHRDDDR